MKGRIQLMKNKDTQHFIKLAAYKEIGIKEAIIQSGLQKSRFYELLNLFRILGDKAFIHGNLNNQNARKYSPQFKQHIIYLKKREYKKCNIRDFIRYLRLDHNIILDYSIVYNWLTDENIYSSMMKRKIRRRLRKEQKEIEKTKLANNLIVLKNQLKRSKLEIHIAKPRIKEFGKIVEVDATFNIKLFDSDKEIVLHGAIDVASGKALALAFDNQETNVGYIKMFKDMINNYGLPQNIHTDRRSSFWSNKQKESPEDSKIQLGFAFQCLGINLSCSSTPQFKPKVERLWLSCKGIIEYFFERHKITTLEEANNITTKLLVYLNNEVLTVHNDYTTSLFRDCNEDLNLVFGFRKIYTVSKDLTITIKKQKYYICCFTTPLNIKNEKVMVIKLEDGRIYASYGQEFYNLIKIEDPIIWETNETIKNQEQIKKLITPKQKSHWHKSNFYMYQKRKKYVPLKERI